MNILVITYWKFDDALIQTYTLPYLRIIRDVLPEGSEITLVTMEPTGEIKKEITVEEGIVRYSFRLHPFGIRAMFSWMTNFRHLRSIVRRKKIETIHTWCTPAGGIGNILSRQTGVPLVLDSYEPHADPMVETGTWKAGGIAYRILKRMERKQVHRARWVIGVVAAVKEFALSNYGYTGKNFLVKPACIDLDTFNPSKRGNQPIRKKLGLTDEIVCVYAGKFGGMYMREDAFRFFRAARRVFGEKFKVLLLTSATRDDIDKMCNNVQLDPSIVISTFVPHKDIPDYMGVADFAFAAIKSVESRKHCMPIKDGEFWALGLPVVIGNGISDDSGIIRENNAGYVHDTLRDDEFIKAAEHIKNMLNSEDPHLLANRIHELARKHRNFDIAKEVYQKIYGTT